MKTNYAKALSWITAAFYFLQESLPQIHAAFPNIKGITAATATITSLYGAFQYFLAEQKAQAPIDNTSGK